MLAQRRSRLVRLLWVMAVLAVAVGLVLYALRQNIDLYFTPTQLLSQSIQPNQVLRLGGIVRPHSLVRDNSDRLKQDFVLTDATHHVRVDYRGILPSLFHDGQGIIVQGHWQAGKGRFIATQVLAKHDARYHPPGVVA